MNKFEIFALVFDLGFILGGIFVGWISWTYLHEKIHTLHDTLHSRFSAFEQTVLTKMHIVHAAPAEKPSAPASVPAPVAAAPAPSSAPSNSQPPAGA